MITVENWKAAPLSLFKITITIYLIYQTHPNLITESFMLIQDPLLQLLSLYLPALFIITFTKIYINFSLHTAFSTYHVSLLPSIVST